MAFTIARCRATGCRGARSVGRFGVASRAGVTRKHFSGRLAGKALADGRYRVTLRATDAAGNASRRTRLGFTVLRP